MSDNHRIFLALSYDQFEELNPDAGHDRVNRGNRFSIDKIHDAKRPKGYRISK